MVKKILIPTGKNEFEEVLVGNREDGLLPNKLSRAICSAIQRGCVKIHLESALIKRDGTPIPVSLKQYADFIREGQFVKATQLYRAVTGNDTRDALAFLRKYMPDIDSRQGVALHVIADRIVEDFGDSGLMLVVE